MQNFVFAVILVISASPVLAETKTISTEEIHRKWMAAVAEGSHKESLTWAMVLFHKSMEPEILSHWDTPPHINLLFDIAQHLIALERWDEAKFCLTAFLLSIQSEAELEATFGTGFSKQQWWRENPIENQLFYQENMPRN